MHRERENRRPTYLADGSPRGIWDERRNLGATGCPRAIGCA